MDDLSALVAKVRLRGDVHLTGDVRADMLAFLDHHGLAKTAAHCLNVAAEAGRLSAAFAIDQQPARVAGWLHDISAVIPNTHRADVAQQWGIEPLAEEIAAPMLLHQKLSAAIAERVFGIANQGVLDAIACHTTLRAGASALDKVVFLADKIAWDQEGKPPYLDAVVGALKQQSLDRAVWSYLDYLWQRRQMLAAVHPCFVAAYKELTALVNSDSL